MALGFASLLAVRSGTDANQYVTASVNIVQDRIYILTVDTIGVSQAVVAPTVTGAGQTWTLEEDNVYDNDGAQRRCITVFRCKGDATESGALTIDYGGITQQGVGYILIEITGADLSGVNGAGAVLQSVSAGDTTATTSRTVTLAAFGSADNAALGFFDKQSVAEAFTEGSGFTELADVGAANPSSQFMAEWKLNETAVSASWTTSVVNGAVALEIKAAAGDVVVTPDQGDVTLAGQTPTVTHTADPDQGALTVDGQTPTVAHTAMPDQGELTLAGQTPDVAIVATPDQGALTLDGFAATVAITAAPDVGVLTLDGLEPTISGGANIVITLDAPGELVLAGFDAYAVPWGPGEEEETGVFVDRANPWARSFTTTRLEHVARVFRSRR